MGSSPSCAYKEEGLGDIGSSRWVLPSKRLLKDYAPDHILGKGTFGIVYACRKLESNEDVAIKRIAKKEIPVEEIRAEAELLQAIDCKQIVKVHQIYYEWFYVFVVMDKFSGGDLVAGLHTHLRLKGNIPCCEIVHVSHQMAKALEYLHARRIVHRDVKGDNYLMSVRDITDPKNVVALADFGAAAIMKKGERLDLEVGTKIFWSPEFCKRDYGLKVDVWAMGVTMYGLLSGCFPFGDDTQIMCKEPKLPNGIHADCADYLKGMLAKSEKKRFSSAEVVAHIWMSNEDREDGKDKEEAGGLDSVTVEALSKDDASLEMEVNEHRSGDVETWDGGSAKDTLAWSLQSATFNGTMESQDTSDVEDASDAGAMKPVYWSEATFECRSYCNPLPLSQRCSEQKCWICPLSPKNPVFSPKHASGGLILRYIWRRARSMRRRWRGNDSWRS